MGEMCRGDAATDFRGEGGRIMDEKASPGVTLHYTGPREHAARAYRRAQEKGLHVHSRRTSNRTGTFTAVLATHCGWSHVLELMEDLAACGPELDLVGAEGSSWTGI